MSCERSSLHFTRDPEKNSTNQFACCAFLESIEIYRHFRVHSLHGRPKCMLALPAGASWDDITRKPFPEHATSDVSRWRHRVRRPLVGIFRGSYSHEPRFTLGIEFHFKAREYCCYDLWKVINNSGTSWARIGWASRRESRTSPPVETLLEQLCHLIQI